MFAKIAYWTCLGLVTYIYVGNPVDVFLMALAWKRDVQKVDIEPRSLSDSG